MRNGGSEVAPCQHQVGGDESSALTTEGQEERGGGGDLDEAASQRLDAGGAAEVESSQ